MSQPAHGPALAHRDDVQGLRAIAVLTVIASHASVPFLSGGFVGVDVFFVISGFLISQLLFREVEKSGRLSIPGFYARRARRILPAATLVTVATILASAIWLSAVDTLTVAKDALWAVFFAANIHFAAVGTDYFAQEEPPSPLQHYWSLSVEEQFYLVWPALLLVLVLLARRRALPRRLVLVVLVVLTGASFAWSLISTSSDPLAAYFSTLARAWELGLGALTALVAATVAARMPSLVRGLVCLAGLVLIGIACVTYSDATPFPGSAAAVPVVGSALVLLAGASGHGTRAPPDPGAGRAPDAGGGGLVVLAVPLALAGADHRRAPGRRPGVLAHGAVPGRGVRAVRADLPVRRAAVPQPAAVPDPQSAVPLPGRGGPRGRRLAERLLLQRVLLGRAGRQPGDHAHELRREGRVVVRPGQGPDGRAGAGLGDRGPARHGHPEQARAGHPHRP